MSCYYTWTDADGKQWMKNEYDEILLMLDDIAGKGYNLTKAEWAQDRAVSMVQNLAVDINGKSCINIDLVDAEALDAACDGQLFYDCGIGDYVVEDERGELVDYENAMNLADRELCEELNNKLAPCTNQEFFDAYATAHLKKYGEDFPPYVGGAW